MVCPPGTQVLKILRRGTWKKIWGGETKGGGDFHKKREERNFSSWI